MFTIEKLGIVVSKFPKEGLCKRTCFANGFHRVGIVPLYQNIDDGLPGIHCQEVCLECGRFFSNGLWFKPLKLRGEG